MRPLTRTPTTKSRRCPDRHARIRQRETSGSSRVSPSSRRNCLRAPRAQPTGADGRPDGTRTHGAPKIRKNSARRTACDTCRVPRPPCRHSRPRPHAPRPQFTRRSAASAPASRHSRAARSAIPARRRFACARPCAHGMCPVPREPPHPHSPRPENPSGPRSPPPSPPPSGSPLRARSPASLRWRPGGSGAT